MSLHDAHYAADNTNALGYTYFSILQCVYCLNSMQRYNFKPQTFCADISQYFALFVNFFKQFYLSDIRENKAGRKNQFKTK
ncbi:hypothetical protein E2986_10852 [Frieseomelitta varia]|uniref:Uncharacterized protein n=1 Tax=Frieseomelitta varia TaxID=561572 RepID=A0A833S1A6_9HYME|nr:hypothetical protein E2986_10852 [Frieseomelitta varia]